MVGATGPLRPAVLRLAGAGTAVVALARRPGPLADLLGAGDVQPLAVDHGDPVALAAALATVERSDGALVYAPDAAEATIDTLQVAVDSPLVRLLPSRWAEPSPHDATPGEFHLADGRWPRPAGRRHLLLGWTSGRQWHDPDAISAAALRVLQSGQDAVLGVVRPWSSRPH